MWYDLNISNGDDKMNEKTLVARWESRGGKYWLELLRDAGGWSYKGNGCGGFLGPVTEMQALQRIQREIDCCPSRMVRKS